MTPGWAIANPRPGQWPRFYRYDGLAVRPVRARRRNPSWSIGSGVAPHPLVAMGLGAGAAWLIARLSYGRRMQLLNYRDVTLVERYFGGPPTEAPGQDNSGVVTISMAASVPYVEAPLTPAQVAYAQEEARINAEMKMLSTIGHPYSLLGVGAVVGGVSGAAAVIALETWMTLRMVKGMFG